MNILVVEDNEKAANYICTGLKENFYVPEVAYNGIDGLHLAKTKHFDLIILDVMLPQLDGWEFITLFRQTNSKIPIIFLSARGDINDKIKGFELGGDDYLAKPFSFTELLLRVRSLLKRTQPRSNDLVHIADLTIDYKKHQVTRDNKRIPLSSKEFLLLQLFVQHAGKVLSRTYIAEHVWDINFECDTNVIDVAVKRLRAKLRDDNNQLIQSVRGVGYVFEEQ
ncbi:MAG: heavy metal response regulator transcription factor [Gammaproteobacteria bacterium]|nr:heavy metal response regulator transcription factor [Gammaproteobacteria bacterium]